MIKMLKEFTISHVPIVQLICEIRDGVEVMYFWISCVFYCTDLFMWSFDSVYRMRGHCTCVVG